MFLKVSDFVGKYKIAKDKYSKPLIEAYINEYETRYLTQLLGCDLYDAFVDSLNTDDVPAPQENRFIDIYNKFCVEDSCGEIYSSDGIVEMLKGFVYYHFLLDQKFKNSVNGNVVNDAGFSEQVPIFKSTIEDRYNLAVNSYISIQLHIMEHKDLYPEFKGMKKRKMYMGGAF